jgi:hypothetical protein
MTPSISTRCLSPYLPCRSYLEEEQEETEKTEIFKGRRLLEARSTQSLVGQRVRAWNNRVWSGALSLCSLRYLLFNWIITAWGR